MQVVDEVSEVSYVTVRLTKAGLERREKLLSENKCLGCEKEFGLGEAKSLGLCETCYNAVYYRTKTKKQKRVRRDELIKEGKLLEKGGKRGRPCANAFTKELAER